MLIRLSDFQSKTRRAKEEEQLRTLEKKLSDELKRQTEHVERVLAILKLEKESLFSECHPSTFVAGYFINYTWLLLCQWYIIEIWLKKLSQRTF